MNKYLMILAAIVAFAAFPTPGMGIGGREGVTPPPGHLPVPVSVGIYVLDITNIDETRNTFDLELDVELRWADTRLAFDAEAEGVDHIVRVGAEAQDFFKGIWTAQIGLANPVGQSSLGKDKITVHSDGRVELSVRVGATCRGSLDFRDFPFDQQELPLALESFVWNRDVLKLVPDAERTGFSPEFAMAEWNIQGLESSSKYVARPRDEIPFSDLVFEIKLQRKSGYYLWKIFLTVFIITSLTFVVFFMSGEGLGRRAGISSRGILTVIAYQFVTTSSLPRVSYLTVADLVMTLSIVTIAATMVVSIFVDRIDYSDQPARKKIDRLCRILFPLGYLTLLVIIIGRHWVL